jgi:hypothetical protein
MLKGTGSREKVKYIERISSTNPQRKLLRTRTIIVFDFCLVVTQFLFASDQLFFYIENTFEFAEL